MVVLDAHIMMVDLACTGTTGIRKKDCVRKLTIVHLILSVKMVLDSCRIGW